MARSARPPTALGQLLGRGRSMKGFFVMPFSADEVRVATNIVAIADKFKLVPAVVHLGVTRQESGWNEQNPNLTDPLGSYGPYQLNQQARPGSIYVATNPWFDYGFSIIQQQWEKAWVAIGGWEAFDASNLAGILFEFAPQAQGSIPWTQAEADAAATDALAMMAWLGR